MNGKKEVNLARTLTKEELKKEKKEKIIIFFLLFLVLIATSVLLVFLSAKLLITGYAYVESKAGYITELVLIKDYPVGYWAGTYGLAVRFSGFTEQLWEDFTADEIKRKDLFFDCIQEDAPGGPEVYASPSTTILWDDLAPANLTELELWMGCSGSTECAVNTFLENISIMLGTSINLTVPATYTYKFDGNNTIFPIGVLNDTQNWVFVAPKCLINKGIIQMLLCIFR